MLASLIRRQGYVSLRGKNHFLTPVYDWIHNCIRNWHPGLYLEVGYRLEYEYSVKCGDVKAAWYSPCVKRNLGRASARSLGGKVIWGGGWLCGRIFYWCEMVKSWSWGRMVEFFSFGECV